MHVPVCEPGDSVRESFLAMQPFEHGDVWVLSFAVAIDAWVGEAGEHFIEAGISEFLSIGDLRDAVFILIPVDLAAAGDLAPKKRQQRFATLLRCLAPERGSHPIGIFD